jgi:hypothetical protein
LQWIKKNGNQKCHGNEDEQKDALSP